MTPLHNRLSTRGIQEQDKIESHYCVRCDKLFLEMYLLEKKDSDSIFCQGWYCSPCIMTIRWELVDFKEDFV